MDVTIADVPVQMEVDTGAFVTIISQKQYTRLFARTVILRIFGVVLFSVFSMFNGFSEIKRHLNEKNTRSDHGRIHGHRNKNETERSVIARH